jgi:hypothetical protein
MALTFSGLSGVQRTQRFERGTARNTLHVLRVAPNLLPFRRFHGHSKHHPSSSPLAASSNCRW